jgi:DNA (cytosine-5)-methyltransferase 1
MSNLEDIQTNIMKPRKARIERLKGLRYKVEQQPKNYNKEFVDSTKIKPSKNKFNCVDLFTGAGGNSLGLRDAGFTGLLSVEMVEDASETYKMNFPESTHFGEDIRKISKKRILNAVGDKTVHVMAAGFPCQGFSTAGKQDLMDERNSLYKQVVRFAKILKPWYLIMENVPGIINMGEGQFIDSIISDFNKIGYPGLSVSILESAEYGVPQLRPRAIFIGNRFELKNPYPKPILSPDKYVSIENAIGDLKNVPRTPEINHEWTKHSEDMEERISKVKPGRSLYDSYADANKRQYNGLPSMTIKENHGTTHIHYDLNRTLSAREMARLQSFPDSFKFHGRMKRVMWQIGNAAPPLLFKHIGLAITPKLKQIKKSLLIQSK